MNKKLGLTGAYILLVLAALAGCGDGGSTALSQDRFTALAFERSGC